MHKPTVHAEPHTVVLPTTINALFDEYAAYSSRVRNIAPETIKEQRLYLDRAAACLGVKTATELCLSLTPKRLMAVVAGYGAAHGAGSRRWLQLSLRSLLRFCYLRNYINVDLSAWVPIFRQPRLASIPKAIPENVVTRLLAGIDQNIPPGRRDVAIIGLLSTYGVRGFQIRHLRLCDLNWHAGRIRFPACKRGKPITQPLTTEAGNRLSDYIRLERPSANGQSEVFLGLKPPHVPFMRSANLSAMIAKRLKLAGIQAPEGVSNGTHGFRHAFASRLCGKIPLKHISDMLGHRDPSSVMVYAKVNFDDLAQAALSWPEEVV